MSFRYENFKNIGIDHSGSPAVYSYETSDDMLLVIAQGYFSDPRADIKAGDLIVCSSGDIKDILIALSDSSAGYPQRVSQTVSSKIINSSDDLGDPISGEYLLNGHTNYIFANGVSYDYPLRPQEGTQLFGDGVFGNGITYTGTGDAVISTNIAFTIRNLTINAPSAANLLNCTGSSLNTCFADNFRGRNTPKLGTVSGMPLVFNNCSFTSFGDGFSYSGANIVGFSMVNVFMQESTDAGATYFDFGTATFLQLALRAIEMFGGVSSTYISSSNGGANLAFATDAVVENCTFDPFGRGSALGGFTEQAVGWEFTGNSPSTQIRASRTAIQYGIFDEQEVAVAVAGTFYEIGDPSPDAWSTNGLPSRWALNPDGSATYNGNKTILVNATIQSSVTKVGGGSDQIEQRLAKNWTAGGTGEAFSQSTTKSNDESLASSVTELEISNGDNIRPIWANNDGISNIRVLSCNVIITRVD